MEQSSAQVSFIMPILGIEAWDKPGEPAHDPEGLESFLDEIRTHSFYGNSNEELMLSYDILQSRLLRSEINLLKDWGEMQKNVSGNTKYDISIILNMSICCLYNIFTWITYVVE